MALEPGLYGFKTSIRPPDICLSLVKGRSCKCPRPFARLRGDNYDGAITAICSILASQMSRVKPSCCPDEKAWHDRDEAHTTGQKTSQQFVLKTDVTDISRQSSAYSGFCFKPWRICVFSFCFEPFIYRQAWFPWPTWRMFTPMAGISEGIFAATWVPGCLSKGPNGHFTMYVEVDGLPEYCWKLRWLLRLN